MAPYDPELSNKLTAYVVASYCLEFNVPPEFTNIDHYSCGNLALCKLHPEMVDIDLLDNDGKKTTRNAFGYVAYNTELKAIVAVFRGTQPASLKNWMDDL